MYRSTGSLQHATISTIVTGCSTSPRATLRDKEDQVMDGEGFRPRNENCHAIQKLAYKHSTHIIIF